MQYSCINSSLVFCMQDIVLFVYTKRCVPNSLHDSSVNFSLMFRRICSLLPFQQLNRQFTNLKINKISQPLKITQLSTRSVSSFLRTKVASKRLYKKYKLKNHRGAASRYILLIQMASRRSRSIFKKTSRNKSFQSKNESVETRV